MSVLKVTKKLFKRSARVPLASLNYHLGNYDETIWVTGDGRSGTTWLGDLINWNGRYRVLFEPFHPTLVKEVREFDFFQYLTVEDQDSYLVDFLRSVFSGKFKHFRADTSKIRLTYDGLLVKDIFSNLMLPWVHHNLPEIKKVMVIRNPFAAALSKQQKRGWTWMTEPKEFFSREALYSDHLKQFEDVINTVGDDFIEKQILISAIVHYVPFQNLRNQDIHIVFYEDLVTDTLRQLRLLFQYLYGDDSDMSYLSNPELLEKINRPSRTSGKASGSNLMLGKDPVNSWKNELSSQQIEKGMAILETFGLSEIYGSSSVPNKTALPIVKNA
ncbi:MAG: sulfotransferase domain-containing protein [Cyanobacteria bacterium J06621_11]